MFLNQKRMEKTIYSLCLACVGMIGFASCSAHEDYDDYVASLKSQTAVIDTISSPASYAVYLDSLAMKAEAFEQLGVKLDPTQKEELTVLSMQIQQALTAKYEQLAKQPACAETVLEASMPVDSIDQATKVVELD